MEFLAVNQETFDKIQGVNDLNAVRKVVSNFEEENHISKKRKAKLEKKIAAGKFKGKKLKRKQAIVEGKRQTIAGKILGVATGGLSKLTTKAGRTEAKKGAKVVGNVLAAGTILAPVMPLMPMMKRALKKKGVTPPKMPIDVLNAFYKNVVKGGSNYDGHLPNIDLLEIESDHLAPAVGAVVSAVLAFVKLIKKKKNSGETLTKIEETIANGTEQIETELEEKAKTEVAEQVGSRLLFDKKTQTIIIIVIVIIIGIAVYIARKKQS